MSDINEIWYLIGALIYMAFVHATYEIFRLYAFKNLLKLKQSTGNMMVADKVKKALEHIESDKAFLVTFSYLWPISVICYIFVVIFDYTIQILSIFNYKKNGEQ